MKKKIFVALLLCLAVSLPACKQSADQPAPSPSAKAPAETETQPRPTDETAAETGGTVSEWFPTAANTAYVYEGNGTVDAANYNAFILYESNGRFQRRVATSDSVATEVLEIKDGKLTLVFGDPLYCFYDDITATLPNLDLVLLQEPFELGGKWDAGSGNTSEITSMNAEVTTPMGNFKAMEVTTTVTDGTTEKYYYVKGLGLVQSVYTRSVGDIVSSLAAVQEETGLSVPVDFAYLNVTENKVERVEKQNVVLTNGDPKVFFETEMKRAPSEDCVPLLTENATINDISFDWASQTATIDLSGQFVSESNLGEGLLSTQLQCLADTFGNFFGVKTAVITIDGKPFAGGGLSFEPGEGLTVGAFVRP